MGLYDGGWSRFIDRGDGVGWAIKELSKLI